MTSAESLSKADLLALLESSGQLSSQIDQPKLVQAILQTACRMTNSPDGSVLLFDPERNGLYFAAAQGDKAGELLDSWGERSNQRVPLEGSNAGRAFSTGQLITNEQSPHYKGVDQQTGKKAQSILSMPLIAGGRTVGVLQVLNKIDATGNLLDYEARDLVLIEYLGHQAAIAISNAQLIAKVVAHMGLYSSEGVEDLTARIDQPAKREQLTVMFADMRGFTQLCQSQDAANTQRIVNDLLTMYADQVLTRGGIVNKFLGDAVLALFRRDDGPKQAIRCAFGMLERFESLRHRWDETYNQDLSYLDLGVGIVTDSMALGSVGSANVRDFTAIGTPVNLANAFQSAAREGRRILVDQATWSAAHEIVADSEGPTIFELRKPGQAVGIRYRQYHIKRLKPDVPVRVFISHNHRDRDFVRQNITSQLARFGIETWFSDASIMPGDKYIQAIEAGLMKSDWVIVVVSRSSVQSDWVRAEVTTAMSDPRFQGRILPVRIDDADPALISRELSLLHLLDGENPGSLGDDLYKLLLEREKALRSP